MSDEDNKDQGGDIVPEEEKKDEQPKGPFNALKPDLLKKCLSKLSKTYSNIILIKTGYLMRTVISAYKKRRLTKSAKR